MYSALTGVQVSVTRTPEQAHWLAYFCWGLLIVTAENGKSNRNIIFRCSFIGYFFLGFHIVTTGTVFDYDTKEKEHQNTRQSDKYSGATPPRINQIASCIFLNFNLQHNSWVNLVWLRGLMKISNQTILEYVLLITN
jgi:hypothetical protein